MYHKAWRAARKYGYRSGLELTIAERLKADKVSFRYEAVKIEWQDLAYRTYTPDFVLDNGIAHVNVEPSPYSDSNSIVPDINSTNFFVMFKPRPVPPNRLVTEPSA